MRKREVPPNTVVNIHIMFKDDNGVSITLDKRAVPYDEAFESVEKFITDYPNIERLQKINNSEFGFMSTSGPGFDFDINTYVPREKGIETHICPRVEEATMTFQQEAGHRATWDKIGEDRVCSYCGSLHPDDLIKICDLVINSEGKDGEVEMSTKGYKIYAKRAIVTNASIGGIKFYVQHLRERENDLEYIAMVEHKVNDAAQISNKVRNTKFDELRKKMEKNAD